MRVLVTGAGGFIGRALVDALRARGHHCDAPGLDRPRVDLSDPNAAAVLLDDLELDALVHAAWYNGPDRISSAENVAWIAHTASLVDGFLTRGGRRVVTLGTCLEYEQGHVPLTEDETPIRPETVYGRAKADMAAATAERCVGSPVTCVHARIGFVYGPGEHPPRVVPALVAALAKGERFASSSGTQRRDYSFVGDVAGGLAFLAEHDVEGAVNIGSGVAIPVSELITAVAREVGAPELVDFGALEQRAGDPEVIELSIARMAELGWQPETTLADGVRRTVRSMLQSRGTDAS